MKKLSALALSLLLCATAQAKPEPYTGPDYSGTYACTGKDDHEGDYTGTVTMELVRTQSTGVYGAYKFKLEVPGYGAYLGQAAARGKDVAIHFALADQSTKDYGTGIASFTKNKAGKWSFSKFYFEPEFKGGNFGMERCVQQ
ncbi:hypothetical protein [Azohydromonas australica]|uniref:hypothetical protein n=1 Tax=Azohydromonas australica TaxID=364039 RepID=UPI00041B2DB8|nr:hypothetical protein [Azohydromonas australica]